MITHENILWYVLRSARPDKSKAIQKTMDMLEALARRHNPECAISRDKANNLWIDTRLNGESTLFMAHMDTVESKAGEKKIYLENGLVHTAGKAVLGADDGAGIGILAALLENNIPALYVFTQREETGGRGAYYIASKTPGMLDGINRCIAFDRKGTKEICGEQFAGVLASHEFVDALADGLGLGHEWGSGTYTDNSEFQDIIPEIVNISVGYQANHGPHETLDWVYWQALRDAVLLVDWESLPTIGPAEDERGWDGFSWPGSQDEETIVRDVLWDICNGLGLATNDPDALIIRDGLDELVDRLADRLTCRTI